MTEPSDARAQAANEQHDEQTETKVVKGLVFMGQLRNVPTPEPPVVPEVTLTVPEVDGLDTLSAALKYAECGWYLAPTAANDPKNPGSVLARDWQRKSSRDPQVITAWLAGTDHGIVLHAGRSGAVIVDVDYPDKVPEPLRSALAETGRPYQSTRPDAPGRGHYPFLQPPGRMLGNGLGRLAGGWGDIRGLNGVIAVAPTPHPDGGEYRWIRTGPVTVMPVSVAELVGDAGEAAEVATDAQVEAFVAAHARAKDPHKLTLTVEDLRKRIRAGESRHETALTKTCLALREAKDGHFPARTAIERIGAEFTEAACREVPGRKARTEAGARSEYAGIVAWAVAQIMDPVEKAAARVAEASSGSGAWAQLLMHAPDHDRRMVCLIEGVLCAGPSELRHRIERGSYEAGALCARSPLTGQVAILALYGAALSRLGDDPEAQRAISEAKALALVKQMVASGADDAAHGEARSTGSGEARPMGGAATAEAVRILEAAEHTFGRTHNRRAEEAAEPVVLPGVPRYPVGQLTGALADLVESTTLPACLVAGAGLGALAGLCGPAALRMPDGSVQRPALWVANIAPAGAAKSPALDYAVSLLRKLDAAAHEKYRAELADWRAIPPKDRPARPADPTHRVDDATLESVARWLDRGDGTGIVECDELSGWLQSIGQYKKGGTGGDKARYLAMWSSQPWRYQRVGDDRAGGIDIYVEHPVVSIVGGIQPHLHHLLGDEDSGFRPRWLVHVSPLEPVGWAERKHVPLDWDSVIRLLHARRDPREWRLTGRALKLWEGASAEWKLRARSGEENASASKALIKSDIQCSRIALVIAESLNPGAGGEIPAGAMECAIAITDYVMGCWRALPGHETFALSFREEKLSRKVDELQGWLETRDGRKASRSGIQRAHVAGVRTRRDLDTLLGEYQDVYPGTISTEQPAGGGRPRQVVHAPVRDDSASADAAVVASPGYSPGEKLPGSATEESRYDSAVHSIVTRPEELIATGEKLGDEKLAAKNSVTECAPVPEMPVTSKDAVPAGIPASPALTEGAAKAAARCLLQYLMSGARRAHGPQLDSQWQDGVEVLTGFVLRYGIADAWRIARAAVEYCGCWWPIGESKSQLTVRRFNESNDKTFAEPILDGLNGQEENK